MNSPTAYILGQYPTLSETFVLREVHALRRRGRRIVSVALHPSPDSASLNERAHMIVHGRYRRLCLHAASSECRKHPLRALRTLATACFDALWPGEPTTLRTRMLLPAQAWLALGVANRLRRQNIQHIHCHFAHAPATLGMYAAIQLRLPFSFTGHANDLFQRRALLRRKLTRTSFAVAISRWHQRFYQQTRPRSQRHYPIVRCHVDTQRWRYAHTAKPASDHPFHLLSVGRLVPKKGLDTLVGAMARLCQNGSSNGWHATVAGDGPERPRLLAMSQSLGLNGELRWLGPVANTQVPDLLRHADAFVLPCRPDGAGDRDGIPVVLIEAMAAGVPVVAGDLPAIRELVRHGSTGLLVPWRDADALADALLRLRTDTAFRRRLIHAARRHVEAEFAETVNIARLEHAFDQS